MSGVLVGREAELAALVAALDDPETTLVAVAGPSGAGKTTLAEAALAELPRETVVGRGRYLEGGGGVAPLLAALAQLAEGALDLLYEPEAGLATLRGAVGEGLDALAAAGFVGERDFRGSAAPPRPVGERESSARITEAADRVARWLAGFGAPMVAMIDDWQRAPPQAAALVDALLANASRGRLTVLTCRRGQAPDKGPGRRTIAVGPMPPEERAALLGEVFGHPDAGRTIADWFGPEGPWLPFDIVETGRALAEAAAVVRAADGWRIDPGRAAAIGREDVAAVIVGRAATLPQSSRDLALAAAMWGEPAAPSTMAAALAVPESAVDADAARLREAGYLAEGTLLAIAHDRLAESLREGAGPSQRAALAGAMARRALAALPPGAPTPPAVLSLRLAAGIEEADPEVWRDRFAEGAADARRQARLEDAGAFAEAAMTLALRRPPDDPDTQRGIAEAALLAAASRGDAALVEARSAALTALQGGPAQRARAYGLAIGTARRVGDMDAAWRWCVEGMAAFGMHLPTRVGPARLLSAVAAWRLAGAMPARSGDTEALDAFSSLANGAGALAFERRSDLAFLVALVAATRARRLGRATDVYRSADVFISACLGEYASAARLARQAADSPRPNAFGRGMSLYRRVFFGDIWVRPARAIRPFNAEVYDLSLAEGDLITAGFALRNDILLGWRSSQPLKELLQAIEEAETRAQRLGQKTIVASLRTTRRAVLRVMGLERDLDGPIEQGLIDDLPDWAAPDRHGYRMLELESASLFGDWGKALRVAGELRASGAALDSHPGGLSMRFHEALACLKLGGRAPRGAIARLRAAARLNPADHAHRPVLLEAEALRRRRSPQAALNRFAEAAELASRVDSSLEAIVTWRCAAEAAEAAGAFETAARYRAALDKRAVQWGCAGPDTAAPGIEQRLAEAQTAAAMAERAGRARARLLADVAHELRTPLQGMQGLLDLAGDPETPLDADGLRDVLASLRTVVDDLADLGAHASGGVALNLKPVDLAALARTEGALCAAAAGLPGDRLTVRTGEGFPALVSTDGPRVRQVLRNLLSNAFKYGEGAPVVVSLLAAGLADGRRALALIVEDSGPGFDDAALARLFEPFDRAGRDDARGLGLGLAVARRIAERLGGDLSAERPDTGGARFVLRFEADVASNADAAPAERPLSILLVEDVELSRRVVAALLRRQGHEVAEAATGEHALTLAAEGRFDLALVDLGLPDIDGTAVLNALKASAPAMRLAALTAAAGAEAAARAQAAGAWTVLFKPVSAEDLAAAIGDLFPAQPSAAFEAEMAALATAAARQMHDEGAALLERVRADPAPDLARAAHRLAGLAGQFGAVDVSRAALALEAALASGADPQRALAALADALAAARQ